MNNHTNFGGEATRTTTKTFPLHDMRSSSLGTPAKSSKPVTTDETIENPIAVINALQKQIEHLEAALRRQNETDRSNFGIELSATLNVLRAHAIIPLYLGKQTRSKSLEPSSLIDGSPHGHPMTVLAEVLRDHLWLLDDAPIPNEMKEAIRESCHYGCNRWEYQTSELAQQV